MKETSSCNRRTPRFARNPTRSVSVARRTSEPGSGTLWRGRGDERGYPGTKFQGAVKFSISTRATPVRIWNLVNFTGREWKTFRKVFLRMHFIENKDDKTYSVVFAFAKIFRFLWTTFSVGSEKASVRTKVVRRKNWQYKMDGVFFRRIFLSFARY